MSLYLKAWIFTLWTVLLLVVIWNPPAWIAPDWQVPLMILWLAHGVIALALVVCPRCGLSLYRGGEGLLALNQPWPRRHCGGCGRDHARDEADEAEDHDAGD